MNTTKQERPTWLVWLDLETTGSHEDTDPILEIGLIVTDESLKIAMSLSRVIAGDPEELRERAEPVVREMHDKNGLWKELDGERAIPLHVVEPDLISEFQNMGEKHDFVLCGSGVSHFDRRFLKSWMPRFERWFRYYSIDVGVLRRSLELIGRTDALLPKQDKAHRALDDARYHLEEMRHIKSVLGVSA
jgi:oligoribonuclease